MSNQNKTTLITGNAAIAESNYEGFLALCTDDTEWTFVGDRILKGKEAVRQYMAITYIEPPIVTVDNLIAEGDFLTAVGKITIKESDGKAVHYAYCDVWRFQDGKMFELKAYVIKIDIA